MPTSFIFEINIKSKTSVICLMRESNMYPPPLLLNTFNFNSYIKKKRSLNIKRLTGAAAARGTLEHISSFSHTSGSCDLSGGCFAERHQEEEEKES